MDYARGDGRSIGPGQGDPWYPEVIDDDTGWVRGFRGLWGHDTRDRLGGERGPAGPRYERDGTVRASWAGPVGWAGLAKVAANPAVERDLLARTQGAAPGPARRARDDITTHQRRPAGRRRRSLPGSPEVRALAGEEARLLAMRREQTRLRDEAASMELDASTASAGPACPPEPPQPPDRVRHRDPRPAAVLVGGPEHAH